MKRIERVIEFLIFNSRWLMAPFYLGLVIALVVLLYQFGFHLFEFGQGLGIVDPHEDSARRHVLAALDRDLLDPPVDTRGYIEPRCIDLALYEQRFRSQEIEDGKRGDSRRNDADDDGRRARRLRAALARSDRVQPPRDVLAGAVP